MSGYRSYVPWNKNSTSASSSSPTYSSAKDKVSSAAPKYESSYTKSRPDAKKSEDKSAPSSTLGSKYASAYNSGYQRDTSATRTSEPTSNRTEFATRIKSPVDKKESHPPVTYRPLLRTTVGSRSRDPSPAEREKTESSSSSSYRLYPRSYTKSLSSEKLDSPSTTIPKYTGRTSLTKDDYKYSLGRTSRNSSKEDLSLAKYKPPDTKEALLNARFRAKDDPTSKYKLKEDLVGSKYKSSKEDLLGSKYKSSKEDLSLSRYKSPTASKEDLSSRYKTSTSRASSREDLTKTPAKYITSRFLPKNSIEKSHTAYLRSSTRTGEVSRKNRELLNVLSTQHDDRSRPTSRSSSTTEELIKEYSSKPKIEKVQEFETVTVITRSTSPTPPSAQTTYSRTRRLDPSRLVEKQITRPKYRGNTLDKEVQSDRLDDSTKNSRFAGASRIAAAPWSSYLDLKYSSPNETKKENESSQSETASDSQKDSKTKKDSSSSSPKSISRNSSGKSLSRSSSKTDLKSRETKSRSNSSQSLVGEKPKLKTALPKSDSKKQLPPQIPKADSQTKIATLHSLNTPNKDFRKSVLNMNLEGSKIKKQTKRSNSVSSAESESSVCGNSETTEISESLSTYPKSSSSKLPQVIKHETERRERRSPSCSSDSSSSSSSAEEETRVKSKSNSPSKLRIPQSIASSRTSVLLSSTDELSLDKSPKPPPSPRIKTEKDGEAKSFLMRALAPVTNFFKVKPTESSDKTVWPDSSEATDKNISDIPKSSTSSSDNVKYRRLIRRNDSGERAWWVEEKCSNSSSKGKIKLLRHVDSGERAWWLDNKIEVPSDVEVHPATSYTEDGRTEDGKLVYKSRNKDSGDFEWWLDNSDATDKSLSDLPKSSSEEKKGRKLICRIESGERAWWTEESGPSKSSSSKSKIKLLRHVESGERAWWLDENAEVPQGVEVYPATSTNEDGRIEGGKLVYKIRPNDSGEREWWLDKNEKNNTEPEVWRKYKIRHIDSGERPWWFSSMENVADAGDNKKWWPRDQDGKSDDEFDPDVPLGDRASPEGLETPLDEDEGRKSPYDNVPICNKIKKGPALFISKHTNIDDILGGSSQLLSPLMDRIFSYQDTNEVECEQVDGSQIKIQTTKAINKKARQDVKGFQQQSKNKLDDAALQLYKDGDYGSYLDLDASISEQQEEFDGFHSNKKNSIVLRTQLSVRVHTIIEKLLTSEGRELRRALFSLKQIFQEDKDLVHEFVQNDGLACLIKVGSEADQNYQNYILRALGQVMLYVDGMNGVMEHNQTVQWLYTLISSKFRLVVKTALKLLLVFVEYTDSNCMLLIKAIHTVDSTQGLLPWHNIMKLLKDFDSADTELLIYATTLINKCLNGVPDQDTYYDQTDALEEQGIENIIQRYMSKPGTDLDLLQQFQIYEAVLQYEDGEDKGTPIRHLDESIRKTLRSRKSLVDSTERRKSRRHSTGTTPVHNNLNNNPRKKLSLQVNNEDDDESSSSQSTNGLNHQNINGCYKDPNKAVDAGVTPALRRRRERAERQRSFMKEQQENATLIRGVITNNDENNENGNYTNGLQQRLTNGNNVLNRNSSRKDLTERLNAANKLDSDENCINKQSWIMYNEDKNQENVEDVENGNENDRKMLLQLKKENTVKDLTQKLASQNILHSPSSEDNKINRIEGMTGLINKAKEGLAKSKSQANVVKSANGESVAKPVEVKKSENELRWEELVASMNRPLNLCDMDFTDLNVDDETDILAPVAVSNGIPPPPPPLEVGSAPPPPPRACIPPPVPNPPVFGANLQKLSKPAETKIPTIKKNKKTVKLFWKEVRDDPVTTIKLKAGFIWDELNPVSIDTQKLEHLFESRAKDLINKKQQELNKNKEIIVLDPKRSNAINIGMTKLPPPRSIKTAILKMDATIMNREGIEKLLTMLPTEEERTKIQEAQATNPDLPLGSAEQFLLTLASISELPARLRLWAFKLDFENTEREIAEPLMDLKQGFEVLRVNKTFRGILSTLLSIGNFLNGNEVKGFQIEYLSKVPEVKDTVHKHSLLHHLCHIVMEKFPDATDLYSEIGAITRASKVDFDELSLNIQRLEADCKASWDHLKLIAKHDGSTMKSKMSDFLADCAERIILVGIIHRRVMNRFHKFLLWLGVPLHQISDTKPNEFCRIVSEFALEYRTTRERVLQQLEKKANHRERNKTRGKMITETAKFRTKEDRADAELRQLLGSDISDVESLQGTLPFRRTRKDANRSLMNTLNGHLTDGDDEILDCLVKTATKAPSSRTAPRERKRTRHADRKSLKRSRTRENPFGHRDSP